MAQKTINVTKPFTLTTRDEKGGVVKVPFLPGIQKVEEAVADHWYVKAHSADLPKDDPVTDTGKPDSGGKKN